jgi:hypothetical protein
MKFLKIRKLGENVDSFIRTDLISMLRPHKAKYRYQDEYSEIILIDKSIIFCKETITEIIEELSNLHLDHKPLIPNG